HRIDLARSWMVGDTLDDVEAGRRAGARSVLLDVGNETQWRITPLRTPHHRVADLLEAAELIVGQARPAVDAALPVMPPHAPVDSTHRAALR
ncbi:HAD hydrolase-like protein, partial [Methylibium sp.]|uniref:HAD hydrolase-like protein n=1 Tax=Methylibium sp. TaxID=2067992 RepID=UPI00286A3436